MARGGSDPDLWAEDHLDGGNLRDVEVAGIRTRVYEAGEGEPLLLIHGGQFGSLYSLDCWSLNLEYLARRFHVVAFDKLGQGHTDGPAGPEDYVVEAVYRHVVGLTSALGLDNFHVLGHSRGGMVAVRLALESPDSIRSLVLVDTGSVAPLDPAAPVGSFYEPLETHAIGETSLVDEVVREPRAQAIRREWITEDFVERMSRIADLPAYRSVREVFGRLEHEAWRPSLATWRAENLARIDSDGLGTATLVMWGFEDRSASRHQGLRLFERIAAKTLEADFVMLAGAGHYVFRDRPGAFNRVVADFCEQVRDRGFR